MILSAIGVNFLHPTISMNILSAVLYTFPTVQENVLRACSILKSHE